MNDLMVARSAGAVMANNLSAAEALDLESEHFSSMTAALWAARPGEQSMTAAIATAEARASRLPAVTEELRRELQPATRQEIQRELAILCGAFPNVGKGDLQVFGRMLVDDVAVAQPSAFALAKSCRELRRSARFLPTIAEVLEVIGKAQRNGLARLSLLERQPDELEKAKGSHAYELARQGRLKALSAASASRRAADGKTAEW